MNANTLDNLTFDQLVPSEGKYLRKEDFDNDGAVLTIKSYKYEDIKGDDGHLEEKVVMYFAELEKGLVLNKTNSQLIPVCTGARNAGEAKGRKIVLFRDDSVSFGGKIVGGLRFKKVPGAPKTFDKPAASGVPFDDKIPF